MWVQNVPGGGIDAIAFAPDGKTLFTRDRGEVLTAWDVAARAKRLARGALRYARAIYPLADGRVVGVAGDITVWEEFRGETPAGRIPADWPYDAVHVTTDGRFFFFGATGREISGIDLDTGTPFPPLQMPDRTAPGLRFAIGPDERLVAVSSSSGLPTVVYERTDAWELRPVAELDPAWDVRFAPDGRTLAASRSGPPRVVLWEVPSARPEGVTATWEPRAEVPSCGISEAAFAINPVLPVFAAIVRGSLTLFDLGTGRPIRTLDFELGTRTRCVCFSPDGLTCAAGGSNRRFVVFDVDA